MRISEDTSATSALPGLSAKAENVFRFSTQIPKMLTMLQKIRQDCEELRDFFQTEAETTHLKKETSDFDTNIQSMAFFTSENLRAFQMTGWEQLFDCEEHDDATNTDS